MIRIALTTPWVRDRLENHPEEAMAVESLRLTTPIQGSLRLSAKGPRGPYLAIVNTETSGFDGYRGTEYRVDAALRIALALAERAA